MDAHSLKETGVIPNAYRPSISEHAVADLRLRSTSDPVLEIVSAVSPPQVLTLGSGAEPPQFVSEHLLAVVVGKKFDVVSDTGKLLFSGKVHGDWHQFATCRDLGRMALTQQRWNELRGRVSNEHITVFDLEKGSAIWRTENTDLGLAPNARSGVALSPDGSLVAIRTMNLVKVFKLPQKGGHPDVPPGNDDKSRLEQGATSDGSSREGDKDSRE
jgi:hypothetical protein